MSGVIPCSLSRCTATELSTPPETNAAIFIIIINAPPHVILPVVEKKAGHRNRGALLWGCS